MFDNLKETIAAAECVISDVNWNKKNTEEAVQYWADKLNEFKSDNPDEEETYYTSKLNEANIKLQMYDAMEKTVLSFVRQALK